MNNIRSTIFIAILAAGSTAMATKFFPFTSWEDLTQKSPDIIIAWCKSPSINGIVVNGTYYSDIEVISVLKGDTKPGHATMASGYTPQQGEHFLMFSYSSVSKDHSRCYAALEKYRVIPFSIDPIYHSIWSKEFMEKSLTEQIHTVLKWRLEDLKHDLEHTSEQIKFIEGGQAK